ncbi:hypothetical protein TTHERM_00481360 (macronuclear) [Tetrahymena thermophila SB210]|uniref:Uncharacterized protein n=1 Tax=Tetrahymena thermophila (strain SB210) TaxID=312017 RepID=I7LV48_TETTS|nr:hypothetical protein TTHERM_00481360 [Tetrahymena thermophila SB210]EAR97202.2 hypothetical protein TTHERM_00481360 [Tetrahymena thermophila SB210]|eukprot:XP_001017447.2 hypothetical protein TTHERM_00481360 [Tetrahymena thermophila SB210]
MINDQAKNLLMINNEEQFKQFTRQTLIQDKFSEFQYNKQIAELSNDRNENVTPINQNTNCFSKNTLENRIIKILKQYILNKIKLDSQNKVKKNHYDQNRFNSKSQQNYSVNNNQTKDLDFFQDLCHGNYKKNDESEEMKLQIKIQAYQHQTDYFCCLVIEEETLQHKIKSLEILNKSHLNSFFSFFIQTGRKLEDILINIKNEQFVKAVIAQCFNGMNNFKDYAYIQKNQFKLNIEKLQVQQIQLEEFKNQILQKFNNYYKQIEIKIQFIGCNSTEVITTYVDKFQQLITNLLENSIQSQLQPFTYTNTQLKNHIRHTQKSRQFTVNSLLFKDNINKSNQETSLIKIDSSSKQNLNFVYYEKRFSNQKEILDKQNHKCIELQKIEQDNFDTSVQNKQIILSIELLKGESKLFNIFKVSVHDNRIGITQEKLLEILDALGIQNTGSNLHQKSFNFLEWKINYHIIGNIGPFYNFYVQNTLNNGYEYHFYMYQDISILNNSALQEQRQFQNNQFTESLNKSNEQFFHLNNINKLYNEICQQNNHFNEESLQKFNASPFLNFNNQFSLSKCLGKCNEFNNNTETQLDQDESTSAFSRKNTLQQFVTHYKDFSYPYSKKLISDINKN